MADERLRVLRMLEAGQITADEAAKLLDALRPPAGPARSTPAGRALRIRISDPATGQVQTTIGLPLPLAQTLARAGIRLGTFWAPQLADADVPGLFAAVEAGQPGRVVEWAEGGRRFEVFIE